jgi:uncharacterized repeat protein (TIGR01451 family)
MRRTSSLTLIILCLSLAAVAALTFPRLTRANGATGPGLAGSQAPLTTITLIPYEATGYKYKIVGFNEMTGFEQPGFNDAGFSTGVGGFGTSCGDLPSRTEWPVGTDILVRKRFSAPAGASNLKVWAAIDNDIQIFINGRDITGGVKVHEYCTRLDRDVYDIPQDALVPGDNLIAVRARDRGVVSYLDIRVTAQMDTSSADLATTISAFPDLVTPGSIITYQINVANKGPNGAESVVIVDDLPDEVTFVSCSASNEAACGVTGNLNSVTLSKLNSGSSVNVTLKVRVKQQIVKTRVISNTVTANSTIKDPVLSNNSATARTFLNIPDCAPSNCPQLAPGDLPPPQSAVSDQKAGSALLFNFYTSSVSNSNSENTRINITNTHPVNISFVHLFFIDGSNCSIADAFICLTPNQTTSMLASDLDPGVSGYLIAVAVDRITGLPSFFNYLIGDEYIKLSSGHTANLGAEAFAALIANPAGNDQTAATATLNFDGVSYNQAARALAADNIPDRASGNDTILILNAFGGDLTVSANTLGAIFGLLYNDTENAFSFNLAPGVCQLRSTLGANSPRTSPRFDQVIPPGHSGWMKLWTAGDAALSGVVIYFNGNAAAIRAGHGHNLHKLTLTGAASLKIPVFPASCL